MKTKDLIKLMTAMVFAATTSASFSARAQELCYQTGFERPTFMPGQIDGQDGWQNPPKTALILPADAISGKQSIRVNGNKLNNFGPGLVGTRFGQLYFYDAVGKTVAVSVDARLKGPSTASGPVPNPSDDLVSANLQPLLADSDNPNQPVYIGELALSSSGYVWIFDAAGNYVANFPVNLDEPHRLGARMDFYYRTVEFFVDNMLVHTATIDPSITTNIFAAGLPAMFALSDRNIINPNLYKAGFDNYCVSTDGCEFQCLP